MQTQTCFCDLSISSKKVRIAKRGRLSRPSTGVAAEPRVSSESGTQGMCPYLGLIRNDFPKDLLQAHCHRFAEGQAQKSLTDEKAEKQFVMESKIGTHPLGSGFRALSGLGGDPR